MIDNIKIILKDFSGDLEKSCIPNKSRKLILSPDEREYENYRLPNRTRYDKHYLRVSRSLKTGTVTVVGSIRKQAYLNAALSDLTQDNIQASYTTVGQRPRHPV